MRGAEDQIIRGSEPEYQIIRLSEPEYQRIRLSELEYQRNRLSDFSAAFSIRIRISFPNNSVNQTIYSAYHFLIFVNHNLNF